MEPAQVERFNQDKITERTNLARWYKEGVEFRLDPKMLQQLEIVKAALLKGERPASSRSTRHVNFWEKIKGWCCCADPSDMVRTRASAVPILETEVLRRQNKIDKRVKQLREAVAKYNQESAVAREGRKQRGMTAKVVLVVHSKPIADWYSGKKSL